ncbi:hypothetical protein LWI28_015730 [Acer negundo]|uniref:Uncharacterized protein n=1 Tax=Acer negundo TaxID=4023 RepID=A0AAD5IQB7_ACENE|nr:hypothetical protein LWI28_015730 [Acer negundo]
MGGAIVLREPEMFKDLGNRNNIMSLAGTGSGIRVADVGLAGPSKADENHKTVPCIVTLMTTGVNQVLNSKKKGKVSFLNTPDSIEHITGTKSTIGDCGPMFGSKELNASIMLGRNDAYVEMDVDHGAQKPRHCSNNSGNAMMGGKDDATLGKTIGQKSEKWKRWAHDGFKSMDSLEPESRLGKRISLSSDCGVEKKLKLVMLGDEVHVDTATTNDISKGQSQLAC